MTTAHFDKHWFLSGYGAYGLKTKSGNIAER